MREAWRLRLSRGFYGRRLGDGVVQLTSAQPGGSRLQQGRSRPALWSSKNIQKNTSSVPLWGGAREEGRVLSLKGRPSLNLHIRELIDSLALAAGWGEMEFEGLAFS